MQSGRTVWNGTLVAAVSMESGIHMERLVDCKAPALPRGTVFRFNGSYPYEHSVDFMLVLDQSWDRPLSRSWRQLATAPGT